MSPPRTAVLEPPRPARREPSSGVAAVLAVLEALDRGRATLAELSRRTGMAKSTLHRVCGDMAGMGWVDRDPADGTYALASRAVALGVGAPDSPLVSAFKARAARLLAQHNETSCLLVLDGDQTVFVAKSETTHAVRLVTELGRRLPAFASASGRVLLAGLPPAVVDAMYAGRPLVTPTGRDIGGLAALHEILRGALRDGFAENVDETALGLHCIAAPVRGPGGVIASMTFCVPSGRMTPARRLVMIPDLVSAARGILPPPGHASDALCPERGRTP